MRRDHTVPDEESYDIIIPVHPHHRRIKDYLTDFIAHNPTFATPCVEFLVNHVWMNI